MTPMRPAFPLPALALLLALSPVGAQEVRPAGHAHEQPGGGLGTIVFPNDGKAAAQAPLLRGVALLHNFEYADAADAFREAQRADSGFALAVWMEALTYSHVVWRYEDLPRSRATLLRLGPTADKRLARARSDRERAFGAAVEAFYADGTLAERVRRYADQLRRLAASDTLDQEAAAFASHAVMMQGFLAAGAARETLFREAIHLSQRVLLENPTHPGATHYLIHLYDSPGMAREGLAFARAYDRIAPDAEHALHMPSHIYLQLGMWDDVVASNERAWAASRRGDAADADWHAFAWLHYAYLQQGRMRAASALIDSAATILAAGADGIDARYVRTRLQFQQNAEERAARRPLPEPPPLAPGAQDRERGFHESATYWLAVNAALAGDTAEFARRSAPWLAAADSVLAGARLAPPRATNALVIRALAARMRGDPAATHEAWRAAARAEEQLAPFVGPPERVFAGELWMEGILDGVTAAGDLTPEGRERMEDALPALQNVLRLCPLRSRTLLLLARVGDLAGHATLREQSFAALAANYRSADADRRNVLPRHITK